MTELKTLSVEELKALREQVRVELAARLTEQAHFTHFEFEPSDDRSYGSLKFTAQTKHGVLEYKCMVGHEYSDGIEITLDGGGELDEGLDVDVPAFGELSDENEVKELCAEAVLAWERDYEPEED